MIYVGSAESEEFDQVLDTIYVGPIPEGRHMFVFQVKYLQSVGISVPYCKSSNLMMLAFLIIFFLSILRLIHLM